MLLFMALILSTMADAPPASLEGTTVDRDGKPVAGADVWLVGLPGPDDAPIVVQGRSDERGRFVLTPGAGLAGEGEYRPVTLWAVQSGDARGRPPISRSTPRSGPAGPARAEAAEREPRSAWWIPTGRRSPGRMIRIYRVHPGNLAVPDPVADRLERTTDAEGRAVLDAFEPQEVALIQVRTRGFGSQPRNFHPPADGPTVVWLRRVAKVSGRLVGAPPGVVHGWKVSALTTPADGVTARDGYWVGEADTTSDERGLFVDPGHRRREPDAHLSTAGGRPLPGREPVRRAPRRGG